MSIFSLYVGNDNLIELDELKNDAADTFVNDAVVTCTMRDSDGVEISGESWPLSMAYVSGSDGKYRATLDDGLVVSVGDVVTVQVDAVGDSLTAQWIDTVEAMARDFCS